MAAPFLDSNVILYAFSNDDRAPRAQLLVDSGFHASAQNLNEFSSVARRKLKFSWEEIDTAVKHLTTLMQSIAPLTVALNAEARLLAERYKFAFYDALIVAAALHADCDTLYSEDMQDGLVIERRLTIRNPFADLRLA